MSVQQISVFLENKTGSLVDFTNVLQASDIDIRAFSITEAPDFGIARVIVDDFDKSKETLKKAGYVTSITPVLAVVLPDRAGGLYEVLNILSEANVGIRYTYAFTGREKGLAYRVFCVDNEEKAKNALTDKGIQVVDQDDLNCEQDHVCV